METTPDAQDGFQVHGASGQRARNVASLATMPMLLRAVTSSHCIEKPMDRTQRLLRSLPKNARIVEVGPSFSPLAPKRDGWDTFVIDHASREELVVKYADQDTDRIEEVDYVWRGGSLADAVPAERHGTFDAFIASHVIEHTTDIVAFLKAAETLIRPDGVVILAVPDKRKCFDFYRHPSATADAIVAFQERRDRHTARTHLDYALNMALKPDHEGSWTGDDGRSVSLVNGMDTEPRWLGAATLPYYVDAHAWVFVPSSFYLMIFELAAAGYVDLRIEEIAETEGNEFHSWLRKGSENLVPDDVQGRRKALMDQTVLELAEQSRQIAGSPLNVLNEQRDLRIRLDEAEFRMQAMQTVLSATAANIRRFGLNRRKFKAVIIQAGRSIPAGGSASVQHGVLLAEARKVLGYNRRQ